MPKHMSLGAVVEKNRIASTENFVVLAEIEVLDELTGNPVETVHLARNNEDILHGGNVYKATWFEFDAKESADSVPELTVVIQDKTQTVMAKCETHGGGVGWKIRFKLVNSGDLGADPEMDELVYILATSVGDYAVDFTLGARNPLAQRFPNCMQWRDKCLWRYKGRGCNYTGPEASCDYTLQGPDGCSAKGNTLRFRGLPGLRPRG